MGCPDTSRGVAFVNGLVVRGLMTGWLSDRSPQLRLVENVHTKLSVALIAPGGSTSNPETRGV
jgi:hypothetical protein